MARSVLDPKPWGDSLNKADRCGEMRDILTSVSVKQGETCVVLGERNRRLDVAHISQSGWTDIFQGEVGELPDEDRCRHASLTHSEMLALVRAYLARPGIVADLVHDNDTRVSVDFWREWVKESLALPRHTALVDNAEAIFHDHILLLGTRLAQGDRFRNETGDLTIERIYQPTEVAPALLDMRVTSHFNRPESFAHGVSAWAFAQGVIDGTTVRLETPDPCLGLGSDGKPLFVTLSDDEIDPSRTVMDGSYATNH